MKKQTFLSWIVAGMRVAIALAIWAAEPKFKVLAPARQVATKLLSPKPPWENRYGRDDEC